jgi:hypothetical protein
MGVKYKCAYIVLFVILQHCCARIHKLEVKVCFVVVVVSLNVQDIAATFKKPGCKYSSHAVCLILFNQLIYMSIICTVFIYLQRGIKIPQAYKFVAEAVKFIIDEAFLKFNI